MKHFKLILLTFLSPFILIAQESVAENICKEVDPFDDSVSYTGISSILYADGKDMKSEGLVFFLYPREKNGNLSLSIIMKAAGMDKCVDEGNVLNLIFANGEKLELVNYNDFDCDGYNYFRVPTNRSQLYLLQNEPVKGVRYTNKRDYQTYTVLENMTDEAKTMFVDVFKDIEAVNAGTLTVPVCEKN